jgi:hypothetical protein
MEVRRRPGFERSFLSFRRKDFPERDSISESEKEKRAVSEPEKSPDRKRRIRKLKVYDPIWINAIRRASLVKR